MALAITLAACSDDKKSADSSPASSTASTAAPASSAATGDSTASSATESSATDSSTATSSDGTKVEPKYTKVDGPVRGFDGKTLTVAGMGIKARFPGAEDGIKARVKRFNDDNEMPGIQINFTEYADDNSDPATALSQARRLVTDTKVFAIVGDMSQTNPGPYLAEQHVPYYGWAFDQTYCSPDGKPTTELWGFGFDGCLIPKNPEVLPDNGALWAAHVKEVSGKPTPTEAIISTDSQSGKDSVTNFKTTDEAAGFKVVAEETSVPLTPVSDWTPYVQKLMTADGGKQPDAIRCSMGAECIQLWMGLQAAGYTGSYVHFLFSDLLAAPMKGTYALINWAPFDTKNAAVDQMKADFEKVAPGKAIDSGVFTGYASTDMLIQALKEAQKNGGISPENVQQASATMEFGIDGLYGPARYPASTVLPTPYCSALTQADGTTFKTVTPLTCSDKQIPAG